MNKVQVLRYVEDFSLDMSSPDAIGSYGVSADGGVLKGLAQCKAIDDGFTYKGIVGANSKYLFVHTNKTFYRHDGEKPHLVMHKIPVTGEYSSDERYAVYRDAAYLALDNDGVMRYDEAADSPAKRWVFKTHVIDFDFVNERMAFLCENGFVLRFSECGEQALTQDGDDGCPAPAITLPTQAQAVCRLGQNTLYVLGDVCYKVTFSADEKDIVLKPVASGIGSVIHHSVARVGDKIVFASKQRTYCLYGDRVSAVFEGLSRVINDFSAVRARAWRGKYALSVPVEDGYRTFLLDVDQNKCVSMLWKDVCDVTQHKGADYMLDSNGKLYRSDEGYAPCRFVRTIDFGDERYKYLRRLNVASKYDVTLLITDESGTTVSLSVKGSGKPQTFKLYCKSRVFTLEIISNGQLELTALSLTAEAAKEAYYGC